MPSLLLAPSSVVVYEQAGVTACCACFSPCQESDLCGQLGRAGIPFAIFLAASSQQTAGDHRDTTAAERACGHSLPHSVRDREVHA